MRTTALALALCACGGDKDTSGTTAPPSCDEIVTEPLVSVPATEWDPALPDALADYDTLAGRWTVHESCGDTDIGVKLVPPDRETFDLVEQTWTSSTLTCGCITDPTYGDDTKYSPLAFFEGFQTYIETFDDPGVQGQTIAGTGGLFKDAPFSVRSCATQNVDPVLGSAYDQITAIVRVESGTPDGTLVLATDAGQVDTCKLTNWRFVAR